MQSTTPNQRKLLTQFNQNLHFIAFSCQQKPLIVTVHEFLKPMIRLGWKMEISNGLDPVNRRCYG